MKHLCHHFSARRPQMDWRRQSSHPHPRECWVPGVLGWVRGGVGTAPLTLSDESTFLLHTIDLKFLCNDELLEKQNLFW